MERKTKQELIKKIVEKKEFSDLPEKDVIISLEKFYKPENPDYENVKITRNFLRKIYSSFTSRKLLNPKEKEANWVLMKHKSTKERYNFYEEIYFRIFKEYNKDQSLSIIDLGCGVNGFSFDFIKKINSKIKYIGVEAIGQLVKLTNFFFKKNKFLGDVFHISLFEEEKICDLIRMQKSPRVVFMFKVIDSLESMQRNYSKELIGKILPFSDKIVLSFATKSLGSRRNFGAQRNWIVKFLEENYTILDDFEFGGERYIVFKHK